MEGKTNIASIIINYVVDGWSLGVASMASLAWFWFTLVRTKLITVIKKRYFFLSASLPVIVAILAFASPWTGWLYSINEAGQYCHGPLYIIQPIVAYGYIVASVASAVIASRKAPDLLLKSKCISLIHFVAPCLIATILQALWLDISLNWVAFTWAVVYIYADILNQNVATDELTGVNNKRSFNNFLYGLIQSYKNETDNFYLILGDVDNFKLINDKYGHYEGDKVLHKVGVALNKLASEKECYVARYGGDEFALIINKNIDSIDMEQLLNEINDVLGNLENDHHRYKVQMSLGYALYNKKDKKYQLIIEAADKNLYKQKENRKKLGLRK